MRHNVTTPGGFFIGLGGIVSFCLVSSLAYLWIKSPTKNEEFRPQQIALGLVSADSNSDSEESKKKEKETEALIKAAGERYNEKGAKPDINNLIELRGVIRYREATKIAAAQTAALNAPSSIPGKTVIEAAMQQVAKEIAEKKPQPSQVALMEIAPDPTQPPSLPNRAGGGAKTVYFTHPAKASTPVPPSTPDPGRPPLLNSPEKK